MPRKALAGIAATVAAAALLPASADAGVVFYGELSLAYEGTTTNFPPAPARGAQSSYRQCGFGDYDGLSLLAGGGEVYDSDPMTTPFDPGQAYIVTLRPRSQIPPAKPDSWHEVIDNVSMNDSLSLTERTICGNVKGVRYVNRSKPSPGKQRSSAKASCPSGTHVLGGGGRPKGPFGKQKLVTSAPFDDDDANLNVWVHVGLIPTVNGPAIPNASSNIGCNGIEFSDGWVSKDVMAHEFTHLVTRETSNLTSQGEPGAVNEAFSDIMGAIVDPDDWLHAEDRTGGMGANRDLQDPTQFMCLGSPCPDRYSQYVVTASDSGGILDDLIVYRLGEQEYLVVANAANAPLVASALAERAAGFDVEVADESADYSLIAIQGPRAVEILAPLTDADLDGIRYYAGYEHTVAGVPVLLARTGYTGEDGFEIFVKPADKAPEIWAALMAEGARHGLVPAGLSARDTLRMEAGMPLYGQELNAGLTPFDAGLGRVVKLDKPGDFVGRAALEKASRTSRERRLIGLAGRGRRPLRKGQDVLRDGAVIGVTTSGAPSPTLGRPIAMAYVDGDLDTSTGTFTVDVRGRGEEVDVVELPFYKRQS